MPCQHDGPEKKKTLLWGSDVPRLGFDCAREKFGLLPAFAPVHASGFIGQVPAALPPVPCVVGCVLLSLNACEPLPSAPLRARTAIQPRTRTHWNSEQSLLSYVL